MDIFRNLELEEVKMTPYWQLQKYPVRINYDSPAHRAGKTKTMNPVLKGQINQADHQC